MTDLRAVADCVLSGQVPDQDVPSLVAQTPGLREELERRSRAMSPALTADAGQGETISSPDALCPADPINLRRDSALAHRLAKQESRRPLKTRGLLSKFLSSLHAASFLWKTWSR